jgi:hypothetical protein
MAIHIDSCAARDRILVSTRSSVYEFIVLRGNRGRVLVRGGRHFPKFRRALFLGSTTDGISVEPLTIDIGRRMKFASGSRVYFTSAVQSICRRPAGAAAMIREQQPNEPGVTRDSNGSPTAL